ncbi:MAG: hypothetical protein M3Z23_17575 [Acidobacteriota bacterium]|nr:hypothetical protein [Acidobacteriota bacterium]
MFLRANRLRLLKRERERRSLRWEQFETLMAGGAPMPEPGFAWALHYRVTGERESGKRAVSWAISPAAAPPSALRQLALVFDWCQDVLSETESRVIAARLQKGIETPGRDNSLADARSRLLASIALADHNAAASNAGIQDFVQKNWEARIVPALRAGHNAIPREDIYPLYEILHAVRDNLNIDLRESYPAYFKVLPIYHLLSYYPASFPAPENEFRISAAKGTKQPDLTDAALSRAAELGMVAFDANAPESQVLQGWLMNDRFLMRGPFGIAYEFLWANPYQPGLSYYHVPLVFHDDMFGRLFVRSDWDDSATWLGYFDGQLQLFRDGRVTILNPELSREPLDLGEATIFFGGQTRRFVVPHGTDPLEVFDVFVVGLEATRKYHIEIDDEEMVEARTDPGGILFFPGVRSGAVLRMTIEK